MDPAGLRLRSRKICSNFINTMKFSEGAKILSYIPLPGEADVTYINDHLMEHGYEIYVPCVCNGSMTVSRLIPGAAMKTGAFGICEPLNRLVLRDKTRIAAAVIPGLAYDIYGTRLGFGKGYYDRYLEGLHSCLLIAPCFDFQIFPQIGRDAHDVPADIIISESGSFYPAKR